MLLDSTPAPRPQGVTLEGRYVTLVRLDAAAHAADLWELTKSPERDGLWQYLFDGPYRERSAFDAAMEAKAASRDYLFYAIVDRASGRAVGYASYLRIEPAHRTIEVGNILYTPALQRTTGATEAM